MQRWTWLRWFAVALVGAMLLGVELWLRYVRPEPAPKPPGGPEVLWVFETPHPGAIISSPCVDGDRVYIGAIRDFGFSPRGIVHALDRQTGKSVWQFDDDGEMIHMYSSPRVSRDRLYIGEGMHANFRCNLYCLDARDGRKHWVFPATGHIESTPCIAAGRVVFGAGDDGLYAVDAAAGTEAWRYDKALHIDSTPVIVDGRVYAGSGVSRRFRDSAVFCLDLATGRELWRVPTDQPAWGSPLVDEQRLFIGLGNGRLDRSDAAPAGAVLCLDARNGQRLWRRELPDVVMAKAASDGQRVFASCRDGNCYALDRNDGRIVWQKSLGSAIVTTPALLDGKLYVVASGGTVACVDPATGDIHWTFDVAAHAGAAPLLFSSPAVAADSDGRHCVYFGAELKTPAGRVAALYALRK